MTKPKSQSLTVRSALALALVAVATPVLTRLGVVLDPEIRQAVLVLLAAAVAYGLRRAQGGLE